MVAAGCEHRVRGAGVAAAPGAHAAAAARPRRGAPRRGGSGLFRRGPLAGQAVALQLLLPLPPLQDLGQHLRPLPAAAAETGRWTFAGDAADPNTPAGVAQVKIV